MGEIRERRFRRSGNKTVCARDRVWKKEKKKKNRRSDGERKKKKERKRERERAEVNELHGKYLGHTYLGGEGGERGLPRGMWRAYMRARAGWRERVAARP